MCQALFIFPACVIMRLQFMEEKRKISIVFAGGGTGGHIYPGLAVAEELKALAAARGFEADISWMGNSSGMDKDIVSKSLGGQGCISAFYGIPSGKLRRYFSLRNFLDAFKIVAGFFKSLFLLARLKPDALFSKGGFVSVPPCLAARILRIPYYTHECDFTPGLATRLNARGARKILLSYEQTAGYFKEGLAEKCVVTGNPVRPVFYAADDGGAAAGRAFLGLSDSPGKPLLLVLGGSLGARQINGLVTENLDWLKERFIVVHQTGKAFADEHPELMKRDGDYLPYAFIYAEMPSVLKAADVVLSRAGANSIWECAVCRKPMLLVPLMGSGTRGDQVDNARFFARAGAALVLEGQDADSARLRAALEELHGAERRKEMSAAAGEVCGSSRPSLRIAEIILEGVNYAGTASDN